MSKNLSIRPRGRPRTFSREAALEAAVHLFWRHGYEGTSTTHLTNAMGVSPPTLYTAFGTKEGLYREALAHYVEHEGRARAEAFQSASSAYRAVEIYLREAARDFADPSKPPGCMVSVAALQCAPKNKAAASAAAKIRAGSIAAFQARFEEAKGKRELPTGTNAAALAHFYGAIVQGMSAQASDGVGLNALNDVIDLALAAWPGKRPKKRA